MTNVKTWLASRNARILLAFAVVVGASVVFALRNIDAFRLPNFYAEDATIMFNNIYTHPWSAFLASFNGYLISGLYGLGYLAAGMNWLAGGHLVHLPVMLAIVSCGFLGLTASLPYLLFRKELGTWLSLLAVLFTALVPLYSTDFTVIGTLGNLKFAFLYIAFLLVIFQLYHAKRLARWQYIVIDLVLLLCVATDVTVAFLLPILLVPHIRPVLEMVRRRQLRLSWPLVLSVALAGTAALYVLACLVKGIPKMPGYLDGPFRKQALLPIIDRSITFTWLYPITAVFNSYFVGAMLAALAAGYVWVFRKQPKERLFLAAALLAVGLGTGLFVLNRPGIGDYYLGYTHKGGPDQFFYAQNMVVVFATAWLLRHKLRRLRPKQWMAAGAGIVLYLLLALPHGTSFGGSSVVYSYLKPIQPNVTKACRQYANRPKVIIQIYPSPFWQWQVDRHLACK